MIVRNATRNTVIAEAVETADTALSRMHGLLGRDHFEEGRGLLITPCSSVHTFFMRFPIDLVFLDKKGKVLKIAREVRPFKLVLAPLKAYSVLELPAGVVFGTSTCVGDKLLIEEAKATQAAARGEAAELTIHRAF